MPAQSLAPERYVVYSVETPDDTKSNLSESRESVTFTSPDFVDIRKIPNGRGTDIPTPSPAPSTPTTDKWGSYWSARERCCCFWNSIMFISLVTLVTIVILVTKGTLELRKSDSDSTVSNKKFSSAEVTLTAVTCTPSQSEPKMVRQKTKTLITMLFQTLQEKEKLQMCTDGPCLQMMTEIYKYMNTSVDPCEDFYTYACGRFTKTAHVSWNSPRNRISPDVVIQTYFDEILDAISQDVTEADTEEAQLVKTVFQSCVRHTVTPLSQVIQILDDLGGFELNSSGPTNMTKPMTLTQLLSETAVRYGTFVLFDVEVDTDMSVGIFNRFSDRFIQREREKQGTVKRYRFLRPSDYIYRDENTDQLLQAYKTYIGDFLGYILGINGTLRGDRRYLAMIDDIYHLDIYINRSMGQTVRCVKAILSLIGTISKEMRSCNEFLMRCQPFEYLCNGNMDNNDWVFYTEDSGNLSDGMSKCQNRLTLDDLQYQFSYNISWRRLFETVYNENSHMPKPFNICYVALNGALGDVLAEFSFTSLKQYIFYHLLVNTDLFVLLPVDTPVFKIPEWQESAFEINRGRSVPRTDRECVHFLSNYIPLNHVIESKFPRDLEQVIENLFMELMTSLQEIISDMYWVPVQQKRHLLTALGDLETHFEWGNQQSAFLKILGGVTDDFFHNFNLVSRYDSYMQFSGSKRRIYSQDDSSVFQLKARVLEVPGSVSRIPLINFSTFPSTWYGSAGTLLSQVISELFDIDALLRFMTEDKIDHRVALTIAFRLQCLVDEYNKYIVYSDGNREYKVQSDITKSANFRDTLALRMAYNTYSKRSTNTRFELPGISFSDDQLFFLAYAQTMCENTNTRGLFKYYIDITEPHQAPGKYRVLGTLSHFKRFAEAFSCVAHSQMNPADKCTFL